jgi:hypothetical protein
VRSAAPWILLALLAAMTPARADGPAAGTRLRIGEATVLASPGAPRGLDAFLPRGARPQPLRWPLPDGPLVVLGLPERDPLARRIAQVFSLDADDLRGGWRLWAWQDGDRPVVFVMAADAAALQAARFEFEAEASPAREDPGMRSLDFRRPNEQAGLAVRAGTRSARPRFRTRAWAPGTAPTAEDPATAAGARADRLWMPAADFGDPSAADLAVGALRDLGVEPVLVESGATPRRELLASARGIQARWGIRHVALVFDGAAPPAKGTDEAATEGALARALAAALQPGGLDELTVVPRACSDDRIAALGAPPDLSDVPEARIAWCGPTRHPTSVPRADAERRVRAARGTPVVLLETWAEPFQGPACASYVPTLPRDGREELGDVLDGVVVLGRRGTAVLLDSLWGPVEETPFGADLLAELVPLRAPDAASFLAAMAGRARRADREDLGVVPWLAPLARGLRAGAVQARAGPSALVPVVPEPVRVDGHLDERPWAYARRLAAGARGVDVLAVADGGSLCVGLRVRAAPSDGAVVLTLASGGGPRWRVEVGGGGARTTREGGAAGAPAVGPGHVHVARRSTPDGLTVEVGFDRFALGGDAHAGRVLQLEVARGPHGVWPAAQDAPATGLLVVGR